MVAGRRYGSTRLRCLSVLALSSRFDGLQRRGAGVLVSALSVLALSSRFDGLRDVILDQVGEHLSVLALSSRFDGRMTMAISADRIGAFSTRSVESF